MTIKEIAQLANVSVSTVSKIMNGKDESISAETREKVVQIAKEYNYAPYSAVLQNSSARKFLIGTLMGEGWEEEAIIRGIRKCASQAGYSVICCQHDDSLEEEKKAISRLCFQNVDGLIWKRVSEKSIQLEKCFKEKGVQYLCCDGIETEGGKESSSFLDYEKMAYEATKYLVGKGHMKLGCLARQENKYRRQFETGFQRCMYDCQLNYNEETMRVWTPELSIHDFMLYGITGIVCSDDFTAKWVINQARSNSYKIPEDLSVIALSSGYLSGFMDFPLTSIKIPAEALGFHICTCLLDKIECKGNEQKVYLPAFEIEEGKSVIEPLTNRMKKIVVVGSINMDNVINVGKFAEPGETLIVEKILQLPGGKGSNQAVGAVKLGARVSMIGKVGQDYEAKILKDIMYQAGVDLEGVFEDHMAGTGKAYISVQENGESSIIVYPGANQLLTMDDVRKNSHIFESASYCLLQLETPMETVEYAAKVANEKEVRVILKPAAVDKVSDNLLKLTHIFVPNEKEINRLWPAEESLEEKAQHFLDKGAENVIVTLGHKGCYLRNAQTSLYFSAVKAEAIDTTGAADAFIAALAVYLSEGHDLVSAIKVATCAAGFSVTSQGAQPSMADRRILELYWGEKGSEIQTRGSF